MSKQRNDISHIKKYLEGKLDNRAMHELERQALDDPFLADAIEGYEIAGKDQQKNIAELSARLQNRTDKKVRSIAPWVRMAVAASLLLIIGVGVWQVLKNRPAEQQTRVAAVVQQEKQRQPALSAPAPVSAQKSPDTNAVTFAKRANTENRQKALPDAENVQAKLKPGRGVATVKEDTISEKLASANAAPAPAAADKTSTANNDKYNAQLKSAPNEAIVQDMTAKKPAAAQSQAAKKVARPPNPETQLEAHVEGLNVQPAHKNLTGYVVGTDGGQPLAGAVVKLAGANFGVVTDANGRFVMHDVPEKKSLVVGYIGYETKQVKINGNDSVNVSLQPAGSQLNEVTIINPSGDKDSNTSSSTDAHPSAGWKALTDYLDKNAVSPDGQTGKVRLSFIVDGKGALGNFKVIQSLSDAADKKAIDLVTNGPAWAGNIDGQPHEVKVTVKFH